mmetsp:Transcript_12393/g.26775  ORF Transcript_12393/g.26775 Transcript_12393/m.26775 type:complete len:544 (-) Transcript_12393:671-2302(-)|eukprot:CAMPEP_0202902170 /NCGR_PEP_ID=MMETSP1392-20130828/16703_1 /ASSEMBLY_ACC=CAM_ASM_000868 /TAXON_ID=225041 /ORGANISM="Chlamydomonas chlamydogama, Strain SAG 11-48b" /LENGTH=543 /DNA_ID=CAMNT_0049588899 /DNA_START=173 /DNA_END=1804 /DNA_ORIENTATION=-
MFAQFKEKISEKIRALGSDELDKSIWDLVAKGTSEELIAPEWSVNMELVDLVNQNPNAASEKLLKALKRPVSKHNAKVQLLTLMMLETCVKNCFPVFYEYLAKSELWFDLLKMAADTSVTRVDGEVRDKILCMVEDYAKVLPQQEFKDAYEGLVDHGVDFPVRGPDDHPPILTPPPVFAPVHPASAQPQGYVPPAVAGVGAGAGAAAAAVGMSPDAFAGMSEEDRAAIEAAMSQPWGAPQQAGTEAAAAAALSEQLAAQRVQDWQLPLHAPAPTHVEPLLPDNVEDALQVVGNTTSLLSEMLSTVPEDNPDAVREPYIVELAEQCLKMRSKLVEMINGSTEEAQLMSALSQHETLQAVLTKYDELHARAESVPVVATGTPVHAAPAAAMAAAAAAAAASAGVAVASTGPGGLLPSSSGGAGPNFTLMDDADEEGEDTLLSSKRQGAAQPVPAPAPVAAPAAPAPAPVAAAPAVVVPAVAAPAAQADPLATLVPQAAPAPQPAAATPAAAVPAPAPAASSPVAAAAADPPSAPVPKNDAPLIDL